MKCEAVVKYCGKPMRVCCDGNCGKAWGINGRPKIQLDPADEDDFVWLADDELGVAPLDPGTYEGGEGKPPNADYFPNKWCVRECERCGHSEIGKSGEPLEPPSFARRRYNIPSRHQEQSQ